MCGGTGLLILSGCATVKISDSEWCGDLGESGAACFHTFKTELDHDLDKAAWDVARFGQLCTPADTFADWKADIEKLCSVSGRCTYDQKKMLEEVWAKIERFSERARSIR